MRRFSEFVNLRVSPLVMIRWNLILAILICVSTPVSATLSGSAKNFEDFLREEQKYAGLQVEGQKMELDSSMTALFVMPGVRIEKNTTDKRLELRFDLPKRKSRADEWTAESRVLYLKIKNNVLQKIREKKSRSALERQNETERAKALLAHDFEKNFHSRYLDYYSDSLSN